MYHNRNGMNADHAATPQRFLKQKKNQVLARINLVVVKIKNLTYLIIC